MSERNELSTVLSPEKQRLVYLILSGRYNMTEIAAQIDKHPDTVRKWAKLPEVKEAMRELQADQYEYNKVQINAIANKALNTMNELLDSPIDGVRYQAAKDVLDRGGFKPTQKTEKKVEIVSYEQNMKDLIDSAIDAEYTIVEGE